MNRSGLAEVAHTSVTGKLTVNAIGAAETYVALDVTGDITGQIAVNPNVHLQVYFDGNMDVTARDLVDHDAPISHVHHARCTIGSTGKFPSAF